jgi:hypothetical protein
LCLVQRPLAQTLAGSENTARSFEKSFLSDTGFRAAAQATYRVVEHSRSKQKIDYIHNNPVKAGFVSEPHP